MFNKGVNITGLITDISTFWMDEFVITAVGFGQTSDGQYPLLNVYLRTGEVLRSQELLDFLEKEGEKLSDDIFIHIANVYKENPKMLYRRFWG